MSNPHPLTLFREEAQLTQKALAKALGISRWSVIALEKGRRNPSFEMMGRITKVSRGAVSMDSLIEHARKRDIYRRANETKRRRRAERLAGVES